MLPTAEASAPRSDASRATAAASSISDSNSSPYGLEPSTSAQLRGEHQAQHLRVAGLACERKRLASQLHAPIDLGAPLELDRQTGQGHGRGGLFPSLAHCRQRALEQLDPTWIKDRAARAAAGREDQGREPAARRRRRPGPPRRAKHRLACSSRRCRC